jgi:tRNA A37 threonylcarbamoyltransferase TsaD
MDGFSFVSKDDVEENIKVIMRQTDYDYDTSFSKLKEANYDHIRVIKNYLGITEKKEPSQKSASINQEIYKQIRHKLDDSMKSYNAKQEEKLKSEIEQNNI